MFAKFKKIGVASAVAAAVGVSGAAQAVIVGEGGGALLVPHVVSDEAGLVNTLIGVTVADPVNRDGNSPERNTGTFPTLASYVPGACNPTGSTKQRLHYYFFDAQSVHRGDGSVETTCQDFVRIDWGHLVKTVHRSQDKVTGYMIISDNRARSGTAASELALYGASYLVQGNWASQAFIPVYPLLDSGTNTIPTDEVTYAGGVPDQVNPLRAGIALAPDGENPGRPTTAVFSMRYFLDPALGGNLRFILWFPDNRSTRANLPVDVFDADEVSISTSISVPDELNIINASTIDGVINDGQGFQDLASINPATGQVVLPINTGFVEFKVSDAVSAGATVPRAGVAFSLVGIAGGANASQVQTELAHERGLQ